MMYFFQCTVFFIFVEGIASAVKLPAYFNKCSQSDPNVGNCIAQSANAALPMLLNGDPSIHVMNLIPLFVPHMFLDIEGHLQINLMNSSIYGLDTTHITNIKWDFKNKRLDSNLYLDYAHLIGEYNIQGRILILPIVGHGPCNITYVKPKFHYFYEFDSVKIKDRNHIQIINSGMTYEVDRAYFKLDNLFNGDRRLGEEMNRFMDENWREINQEIGARVGDALAEVFTTIINQIFARVPENELFLP